MTVRIEDHFKFEAEDAVLGSLLLDNSLIDDIAVKIRTADFVSFVNKAIYETILNMKRNNELPIDFLTIAPKIKLSEFTHSDILKYLVNLTQSMFSTSNATHYADLVKKESDSRKRKSLWIEALRIESEKDSNSFDFVRKEMMNIENNRACLIEPYISIVNETLESLDKDFNRTTKLTGVATGFNKLDEMTNGFQKGDLIIIGARPGMGKTMFAQNILDNIGIRQQLPVVFFSLEMNKQALCKRSLSRFTKIPGANLFSGNLTENDWEKLQLINDIVLNSKIFINDRSQLNIHEMRNYCRQVKNHFGLVAVFIDYLSLMKAEGENETLRISNISADLKALAKDFEIPVIALAQLNRDVEKRSDKRPVMSDIKQSGNIEQDADIIMFLYCESYYNPNFYDKERCELIIGKQRNGQIGTILLKRNLEFFEFKDYDSSK